MSQILKKGLFSFSLELVVVFRVDIFFFWQQTWHGSVLKIPLPQSCHHLLRILLIDSTVWLQPGPFSMPLDPVRVLSWVTFFQDITKFRTSLLAEGMAWHSFLSGAECVSIFSDSQITCFLFHATLIFYLVINYFNNDNNKN